MSNPNPLAAAAPARPLPLWIGGIALAVYGVFLWCNFSNVAGGADSSGYLNSARLLASGQLAAEMRAPPEFGPQSGLLRQQFQPHGFVPFDGNPKLSPTYAVGLPLHLALAGKLFGWSLAPYIVGVGGALAALLLIYAIARRLGLEPWLAFASAAMLAAYPVVIFTSLTPISDTLATTWCLAAIWTALRAKEHAAWALACGAAVALAVLVRATNLLVLPAVIVALGFNFRRLAGAALGGAPGAVWLGYYNHALYGGVFRTGYVDISDAFGWKYGGPTALHFLQWLALLLPAALLVLPFVAVLRRSRATATLAMLALWFVPFAVVYSFYEISHEVWWCLRFILPGTPALILAALLGVEAVATSRKAQIGFAAGLMLWSAGLSWFWTNKFHLLLTKTYERAYADAAAAARAEFPAHALVVAGIHSGALFYYTPFSILRWEFVRPEEFARFRQLTADAGRPICAVLHEIEERGALQEHCPGNWRRIGAHTAFELWRLEPGEPAATPK
jgi:hypothetical protein